MSKMPMKPMHKTIFGVPILMESSVEEARDWVVVMKEVKEDMKEDKKIETVVHHVCQMASTCTSEEPAIGMLTLHGKEEELEDLVMKSHGEIDSIEADAE